MRLKWAALLILPISFFMLYSSPLWKGMEFHPSLIENDALHYEDTVAFFHEGFSDFRKYGIGAHLLEYAAVTVMLSQLDEDAPGFDPVRAAPRLSAWYHCLLAACSLLFFFGILRPVLGNQPSFLAAVFLGLNPAMAFFAINAGVNIPFFFFLLGALFFLDQWCRKGAYTAAISTGIFSALAFINKEYFGFLMLAFPVCLFLTNRKRGDRQPHLRKGLIQTLMFLAVFFAVVLGLSLVWLDPGLYWQHLRSFLSSDPHVMGPDRYDLWRSEPASIRSFVPNIFASVFRTVRSIPIALAAFAGIYLMVRQRKYRTWVLMLPAAVYLFFIPLPYDLVYFPYLFPLLPAITALAVIPAAWLWESRNKLPPVLAVTFALVATADLLLHNIYFHLDMGNEPRLLVEEYFETLPQNRTHSVAVIGRNLKSPALDQIKTVLLVDENDSKSPVDYAVIAERTNEQEGNDKDPCALANRRFAPAGFSLVEQVANSRKHWRLKINEFNQSYFICRADR